MLIVAFFIDINMLSVVMLSVVAPKLTQEVLKKVEKKFYSIGH